MEGLTVPVCDNCLKDLPSHMFPFVKKGKGREGTCLDCKDSLYISKRNATYKAWSDAEHGRTLRAANRHTRYAKRNYLKCDCCSEDLLFEFVRNRPKGMAVDHIICASKGGKHCLSNLQYMTIADHNKKTGDERRKGA